MDAYAGKLTETGRASRRDSQTRTPAVVSGLAPPPGAEGRARLAVAIPDQFRSLGDPRALQCPH